MKAMERRLRRLEESFGPQVDEEDLRLGAIVLERRRKRLEAQGEILVPPPTTSLKERMYGRVQRERQQRWRTAHSDDERGPQVARNTRGITPSDIT